MLIVMNVSENLYRLTWLSRPLMQSAESLVEQNLENTGLSVRMRAVLEVLHTHGNRTVPEVAYLLRIKRQYVQVMVNEVIKAGYAQKNSNPQHRSSSLIALTPEGTKIIKAVRGKEKALMSKMAKNFNPEEVEIARRVVESLLNQLDKKPGDITP